MHVVVVNMVEAKKINNIQIVDTKSIRVRVTLGRLARLISSYDTVKILFSKILFISTSFSGTSMCPTSFMFTHVWLEGKNARYKSADVIKTAPAASHPIFYHGGVKKE